MLSRVKVSDMYHIIDERNGENSWIVSTRDSVNIAETNTSSSGGYIKKLEGCIIVHGAPEKLVLNE